MSMPSSSKPVERIRYGTMLFNLCSAIFWLTLIWNWPDLVGSTRVIATAVVVGGALIWLGLWFFRQSAIARRTKWTTAGIILAFMTSAVCVLRVSAFTGDFIPVFEWRWSFDPPPDHRPDADVKSSDDWYAKAIAPKNHWSGFFGPSRDGSAGDIRFSHDWKSQPPKLLWRKSIGKDAGFSSFAVAGNLAVTQQQDRAVERVICYHLRTGKIIWVHSDEARFQATNPMGGIGPRATPTIDGDRVYTMGATGILNCLSLKSGDRLWSHHVLQENDATNLTYGIAASPLIDGERVVVSTGRSSGPKFATLVAYHKISGDVVWKAGKDTACYASPVIGMLAQRRMLLSVNENSVTGHDPGTGKQLWRRERPTVSSTTSQPLVVSPDKLLISKGYGNGARLWQLKLGKDEKWQVNDVWENRRVLRTKSTSAVINENHAYALSDGFIECVSLDSGKRRWKARGRYGHGQLLLANNFLLIQAEFGDVALVRADPRKYSEIARFAALSARTWNYPVVTGKCLLVRNDREIACYELPGE